MLSENEVRTVLSKLCVKLGFCLPPVAQQQLASDPPPDVRGFVDAVFAAEGLDPATADRHLYRQVRDMVSDAYRKTANAVEDDA
jgi:hypothetical protein